MTFKTIQQPIPKIWILIFYQTCSFFWSGKNCQVIKSKSKSRLLWFFLSQKFSFVPDLRRRIKIRFGISEIISLHCLRLKFVELHELRGQSIKNMIEASSMPYSIIEILLQAFVVCTINVTQRRRIYHNKTIFFYSYLF